MSVAVVYLVKKFAIGLLFTLHGLAHAAAGMAAQDEPHRLRLPGTPEGTVAFATLLFCLAMPGFVAAGLGAWGAAGLESRWRPVARVAAVASALLLVLSVRSFPETAAGLALDALALVIASRPLRFEGNAVTPILRRNP